MEVQPKYPEKSRKITHKTNNTSTTAVQEASQMKIEHWDTQKYGDLSETALRQFLVAQGFSVTRYIYPPGTKFPEHHHSEEKIDAVIRGTFRIEMNGESLLLQAGDYVHIPKGCLHSAEVLGDETVISLDAVKLSV